MRGDLNEGGFWGVSKHALVLNVQCNNYFIFATYIFTDTEIYTIIRITNSEFDIKSFFAQNGSLFCSSRATLKVALYNLKIMMPENISLIS